MKKIYAIDISPINFFGSGVFAMGRSGYLKHGYFFARPKELFPQIQVQTI